MGMGFPVTTPGLSTPVSTEYVSTNQPIICALVPMSGAGMSFSGPMIGKTA